MDLRQLECFLAVAEELHFGRAADRLHVAQPSVSNQVKRLERSLGVQLFERTSRSVKLSLAGERLVPEARSIMSSFERAAEVARGQDTPDGGVLRLGYVDILNGRLDRLLDLFTARMPGAKIRLVHLQARERLRRVRSGELDAALIRSAVPEPGVLVEPLWQEPSVVVLPASHAVAAKSRVRLADLRDLPVRLVPRTQNATFVDAVVTACRSAGFEPVMGPHFTSLQETLADIGTGAPCWTILHEGGVPLVATRRVAIRPLQDAEGLTITTSLVAQEKPGPMVRALLEAVRGLDV